MKGKEETVSVIIPVFNAENFVERAVNSALNHNCVGEVILVEDGSSDNSYEICLRLAQEDNRVKIFRHPNFENKGVSASRNLGIKKSSFPLIAFLDADDTYYANRFSEALLLLQNNLSIDGCFGVVEVVSLIPEASKLMGMQKRKPGTSILTYLLHGGYFHTNSITVRKEFLLEVGVFDESCKCHEDSELWIRMASSGKIVEIEDKHPIASYIMREFSLIKSANSKSKLMMWEIVLRKNIYSSIGNYNKFLLVKQLVKWKMMSVFFK